MILLGHVEHAEPVIDLRWIDQQLSHTSFTVAQKITEALQTRAFCSVWASLWDGLEPCPLERDREQASKTSH